MPVDFASIGSNLGKQMMSAAAAKDAAWLDTTKKLADIDMLQGRAENFRAQAEEAKRIAEAQKPENVTRLAAGFAGLTDDKAPALHDYMTKGDWGMNPAMPDDVRQMTIAPTPKAAPDWATPDAINRAGQYRTALAAQGGLTGKTDFNNLIGGMKGIWEQQQIDDAKTGRFSPQMARGLNTLEAAKKGSLYDASEYGVFDNSTGTQSFNQPYLDKNASMIAENNAQAASAYANAGHSKAQAEAVRLKMTQPQVIVGPDGTTTVLDPKTGLPMGTPKPTGEYLKQQTGVQNVRQAITDYRNALANWNKSKMLSPDARAELGTFYNNMLLQAKEAYNLGVLNGPDYQILQEVVANPNSFSSTLLSKSAIDGQAAKLDDLMGKIGQNSAAVHRQPMPGEVTTAQLVDRKQPEKAPPPPMSREEKIISVNKARRAIADGRDKATVLRMLEEAGIPDHGIR